MDLPFDPERYCMKYAGMPSGMWILYRNSFRNHMVTILGVSGSDAEQITRLAKPKYKEIIAGLPEFEKADRFKMNIVNCALLAAFILSMPKRPGVEELTDFYAKAMMNGPYCDCGYRKKETSIKLFAKGILRTYKE